MYKNSGLGKWIDEKWVDISRKDKNGKHPECGANTDKKGYPKCRPQKEASKMSDDDKKSASNQKRRVENKTKRIDKKPNWVSFKEWVEVRDLVESSKPNDPSLWSQAKAKIKKKFKVYPSAYANLAACKEYKKMGGTWSKKD